MSSEGLAALRALFADRYRSLRVSVGRRLGGASDMAEDALHEAYVRLADKGGLEGVRHPATYLVNTAVHVAIDRLRSESRQLSESEVEDFLSVPDTTPGPAEIVGDRQRVDRMQAALGQLPARQQDILMALRVHGLSRAEVAKRWGISERQVTRELVAAHTHCVRILGEEA